MIWNVIETIVWLAFIISLSISSHEDKLLRKKLDEVQQELDLSAEYNEKIADYISGNEELIEAMNKRVTSLDKKNESSNKLLWDAIMICAKEIGGHKNENSWS